MIRKVIITGNDKDGYKITYFEYLKETNNLKYTVMDHADDLKGIFKILKLLWR